MALDFPNNPSQTDIHNASNGLQYVYDGTKWVTQGRYDLGAINAQKLDSIANDFNGVLTTFNLKINNVVVKPASAEAVHIVLAGHLLEPGTAYTISTLNGTITFATAPTNGTAFFGVVLSRLPIVDFGTGTIKNVNIASDAAIDGTKVNPNFGNNTITGVTTTQSATDNTTKLASTAFVQTAISNLIDSSPDALNTLNELAAALGDDASFSTTVTTALAAKAPLASPTFTGTVSGISYNDLDDKPTIPAALSVENVQDIIGAMVTGNTETGISVTYDEKDGSGSGYGKLDFAVSTTYSSNQRWNDGVKALFGTNDGLEIYHDASDSNSANHHTNISETGGGGLLFYASDIIFHRAGASGHRLADFAEEGAVRLYYDAGNNPTAKLATSATGVTVDGTVTATAFSGDGSNLTGIAAGSLPIATASAIGGIKVGSGLTIDGNGLLEVSTGQSLTASNINSVFGDTTQLILGNGSTDNTSEGNTNNDDALVLYYGSNSGANYGVISADTGVHIQYNGANRLETHSGGTKWIGDLFCDDDQILKLGNQAALKIYHDIDGSNENSIIDARGDVVGGSHTNSGGLLFYASDFIFHEKSDGSHRIADFAQDGGTGVRLYYDNSPKFQTTNTGVTISGNITVTGTVDGRDLLNDGQKLDGIAANANNYSLPTAAQNTLGGIKVGTNLSIDSDGVLSASQLSLTASAVNDLYGDNGNLILGTGSGNDTLKLYYDGSNAKITSDNAIHLQQNGANKLEVSSVGVKWIGDLFADANNKIKIGPSAALEIYHDNSNSIIDDTGTGGLLIYGSDIILLKTGSSSRMADFAQDGAVRLYEGGTIRLTTTNAGVDVSGNIVVSGNVDGRDVAADGTKLDGIESGATADQTAAEIRTLVGNASDSNVFTDALQTKLNGIGANANNYSLPIATNSVLGGIKVGNNLSIDASTGVLSASASAPTASTINDLYPDNGNLILGTGSGDDTLKLFYNGSAGIITADGGVQLQYNGSTKLLTKNSGVGVTGNLEVGSGQITCGVHGTTGIQIINDGTFGTLHSADLTFRTASAARATIDTSGNFNIQNDTGKIRLGAQLDLQLFHDNTNSYIDNGEGALNLRLLSNATSIQLIAGSDYMARFVKNGTVQLYWDHNLRLETASSGVKWFGDLFCDSDNRLKIGNSAALEIYHQSSNGNSIIKETGGGILSIQTNGSEISLYDITNSVIMAQFITGGACQFKHGSTTRLATASTGIDVTGNIGVSGTVDGRDVASDGSKLDGIASNANNYSLPTASASTLGGIKVGSNLSISNGVLSASASGGGASGFDFNDNVRIKFGADDDLQLFHDTNNSVIDATGTGSLLLYGSDIIFQEKSNTSHRIADFAQDGSTGCRFYYDNSVKLKTYGSGAVITGTANIDGGGDEKIILNGSTNPYIRFREGSTNKAYIQWNSNGKLYINNQESGDELIIGSGTSGLQWNADGTTRTVYHTGNLPTIPTNNNQLTNGAGYVTTDTTYSVGDGGLTQKNFTTTLKNKLDGIAASANNYSFPYTISQSASNGTVVRRNDSGYIFANYFNTTPNDVTSGVTKVCVETSNDGYIRHGTPAAIRSFINVADGANNYSFPYTISASASNGTVVLRHSSGYIFSNYINTTDNSVTGSISAIMCKQSGEGDYHRSATAAAVRSFINVENGATADQTASDINALYPDNGNLILGTGSGSDTMKMYYNGTVGVITANNGVFIQQDGSNKAYTRSNGLRVNSYLYLNNDSRYLRDISGQYGTLSCVGAVGGYAGYSIDGRVVFMHNGGTTWGLFNDVNNHWLMVGTLSGNTEIRHANSTKILVVNFGAIIYGTIRPHQHNGGDCGAGDARWGTVYASNGSINTSDRNEKNSILEADLGLDFINKLNPVSYKWNDVRLGTKTRYGLIAQDIEETIKEIGKDVDDVGMIDKPEKGAMGLNYSELIAPLVKAVQELSAKVAALEAA